jgi:hypothetical protein
MNKGRKKDREKKLEITSQVMDEWKTKGEKENNVIEYGPSVLSFLFEAPFFLPLLFLSKNQEKSDFSKRCLIRRPCQRQSFLWFVVSQNMKHGKFVRIKNIVLKSNFYNHEILVLICILTKYTFTIMERRSLVFGVQ